MALVFFSLSFPSTLYAEYLGWRAVNLFLEGFGRCDD